MSSSQWSKSSGWGVVLTFSFDKDGGSARAMTNITNVEDRRMGTKDRRMGTKMPVYRFPFLCGPSSVVCYVVKFRSEKYSFFSFQRATRYLVELWLEISRTNTFFSGIHTLHARHTHSHMNVFLIHV